jgi:hypothetical protein
MPANTAPIFTLIPAIEWSNTISGANTATDGTGTPIYPVFTASTNGSYVQKIRFRHTSSNATATVARIFINNGGAYATAANNVLFDEITISTNTLVQTAASVNYELPLNFALPPNYILFVTIGTAANIDATVIGGDY